MLTAAIILLILVVCYTINPAFTRFIFNFSLVLLALALVIGTVLAI